MENSSVEADKTNLLGLPRSELEQFVAEKLGAKPFRARQLMKWIYKQGAADFSAMTDLARDFRAQLEAISLVRERAASRSTVNQRQIGQVIKEMEHDFSERVREYGEAR